MANHKGICIFHLIPNHCVNKHSLPVSSSDDEKTSKSSIRKFMQLFFILPMSRIRVVVQYQFYLSGPQRMIDSKSLDVMVMIHSSNSLSNLK